MSITWQILQGNSVDVLRTLPSNSVHCCITSPPYYALRCYGVDGQLGLEPTLQEFIANLVEVFREVRRVLRPEGTCWINIGDSYAQNGKRASTEELDLDRNRAIEKNYPTDAFAGYPGWDRAAGTAGNGLKVKDLMGVPWRLALALQDDGWWLRSDIIWNKTNPMPNSVKDRPGMCHEYIFLLTKNSTYYYDWLAVREPVAESTKGRVKRGVSSKNKHANGAPGQTPHTMAQGRTNDPNRPSPSMRNRRTVWNVACKSVGENFFAAYPPKLIEPCVLAGSSEYGVCAECGCPWKRIVEPSPEYAPYLGKGYHDHSNDQAQGMLQKKHDNFKSISADYVTAGWQATCKCNTSEVVPATILDPFAGAGTTLMVANRFGRSAIGIELNPATIEIASRRIQADIEARANATPVKEKRARKAKVVAPINNIEQFVLPFDRLTAESAPVAQPELDPDAPIKPVQCFIPQQVQWSIAGDKLHLTYEQCTVSQDLDDVARVLKLDGDMAENIAQLSRGKLYDLWASMVAESLSITVSEGMIVIAHDSISLPCAPYQLNYTKQVYDEIKGLSPIELVDFYLEHTLYAQAS